MSKVSTLQRHLIVGAVLALGLGAIADQATSSRFSSSATSAAGDFFNWVLRFGAPDDKPRDHAAATVVTEGDAGSRLTSRDLPARTQAAPVTLGPAAAESRLHALPLTPGADGAAQDAAKTDRRDGSGGSGAAAGPHGSNGNGRSGPRLGLDAMFQAPGLGSLAAIGDHARVSGIVFDRAHLPWSFDPDATSLSVKSMATTPSAGEATSFPLPDVPTIPDAPVSPSAPDPGLLAAGGGASSGPAAIGTPPAALPSGAILPPATTGPVPVTSPLFASVPLAESLSAVAINTNPGVPQLFTPAAPPVSSPSLALGDEGIATGPFIVNPEPATLILTMSGLLALLHRRRAKAD